MKEDDIEVGDVVTMKGSKATPEATVLALVVGTEPDPPYRLLLLDRCRGRTEINAVHRCRLKKA